MEEREGSARKGAAKTDAQEGEHAREWEYAREAPMASGRAPAKMTTGFHGMAKEKAT